MSPKEEKGLKSPSKICSNGSESNYLGFNLVLIRTDIKVCFDKIYFTGFRINFKSNNNNKILRSSTVCAPL